MPAEYCAPTELVQGRRSAWYETRIGRVLRTVQHQRIYVCILFWKIMLNRSLIVILWPICRLLKQIINHNRSKFALSKLVLTGVCCKDFMYSIHVYAPFVYTFLCARGVYVYLIFDQTSIYRPKFRQYSSKIWMAFFFISLKFG